MAGKGDTALTVIRVGGKLQAQPARRSSWTPAKQRRFLTELAATANIRRALAAAGASASSAYARRRTDPGFEAAWDAALNTAASRLEADMLARALSRDAGDDDAAATDREPMSDATRLSLLALHAKRVAAHRGGRGAAAAVDTVRLRREITERLDRLARSLGHEVKR